MRLVALFRGINVGGNRKVPMGELRTLAEELGFGEIETYINSGNLVFEAGKLSAAQAASRLDRAVQEHFGFSVDIIVRSAKQWSGYAAENPFPAAAKSRPNLLMLGLSKLPPAKGAAELLAERAGKNERVKISGDAIWVDFADGVGRSKLNPGLFDKAAGSPVTLRNWRTVQKLAELLADVE